MVEAARDAKRAQQKQAPTVNPDEIEEIDQVPGLESKKVHEDDIINVMDRKLEDATTQSNEDAVTEHKEKAEEEKTISAQ